MRFFLLVGISAASAWSPMLPTGVTTRRLPLRMDVMDEGIDPEAAKLALSFFVNDPEATITPTSGGVNNYVFYVTTNGEKYVLRVYNNGGETERVRYEHSVLEQLEIAGLSAGLPFQLPKYLPALESGETMAEMPDGNQACLSQLIPGALPKTADPKLLGRAVGQLMMAMGALDVSKIEGESCHPYFEIYQAHPSSTKETFYEYAAGPDLDVCRDAMNTMGAYAGSPTRCHVRAMPRCRPQPAQKRLLTAFDSRAVEEFKACDAFIESGLEKGLPKQVIHGDLHYDNVLCDEETGEVTGLLDFEFCGMDWRAIELAVCLSKYVGEEDPFPLVESFIDGFCESGRLTADEMEGLPDMINMRVMSNAIYFVGRAIAKEDTIKSLTKRADMYAQRMVWVRDNREKIVECIKARMPVDDVAGLVTPTGAAAAPAVSAPME